MRFKCLLLVALMLASFASLKAEGETMLLWPEGAPGALGDSEKDRPTLTLHIPAKATGAAMLLIPGGSYQGIYAGQAEPFALWLNEQGITVFVLRYRLGSSGYRYPSQLQDAVEAIRQIRGNAAKWKIDPQRIGAMGFSAGGHLLTTLLNRPEDGDLSGSDAGEKVSPRPDLAIVCYPVISMITRPHQTSRKNLIGDTPDEELTRKTSSELQVRSGLPPVFLWHTSEDKLVPADHALLYAAALREHKVPCEFHLYQHGDHGTGLMGTGHPWFGDLLAWLEKNQFLASASAASETE